MRNAYGNREVSLWYLDSTNHIQLSGTSYAWGISEVSITCMHDLISDVVTAVWNSSGALELIQRYYGRFGTAVTRGNTVHGSAGSNTVAAAVPLFSDPNNTSLYTVDIVPGYQTV
jgi:hypothetical protein